jgi:uncharacterized protein YrrD
MTDKEAPEDLGAPVAYLVLKDGTPVYDRSGDRVGEVEHVLDDEQADLFHGLIVSTAGGHRFARADQVDGLYERGVIVSVPAGQLAEPSADPVAQYSEEQNTTLKRAWEWLVRPR